MIKLIVDKDGKVEIEAVGDFSTMLTDVTFGVARLMYKISENTDIPLQKLMDVVADKFANEALIKSILGIEEGEEEADKLTMLEEQECTVTLKTPFKNVELKKYMLLGKSEGSNMIEINGLDIEEIQEFSKTLDKLIKEQVEGFCEELEKEDKQ